MPDGTFLCWIHGQAKIGDIVNGHKCVFNGGKGWGTFRLDNSQEWSDEQKQQWEIEKQRRRQQHEQKRQQIIKAVGLPPTIPKRIIGYRELINQLPFDQDHRENLRQRGLIDSQIDKLPIRTVKPGQKVKGITPGLPGVSRNGEILVSDRGIAVPAFNLEGEAIAYQYRRDNAVESKYRWFKSDYSSHIDDEMPLTICRDGVADSQDVYLCEGLLKPLIFNQRRKVVVIGASGGLHASSPKQLKTALDALKPERVIITPDAGAVQNKHILRQYRQTFDLLQQWGYNTFFLWWGQVTKEHCDIDELPVERFSEIRYLSPTEFFGLTEQSWDGKVSSGNSKSIQNRHASKENSSSGGASLALTDSANSSTASSRKIISISRTRSNGSSATQPPKTGVDTDGLTNPAVLSSSSSEPDWGNDNESNGDREITKEEWEARRKKTKPDEPKPSENAESETHDKAYWIRKIRRAELTYKPDLVVDLRHLEIKHKIPRSGLIGVKSPKDTGKTFLLSKIAVDTQHEGRAILNPTHRISLGRAMAKALGLTWVDDKEDTESFLHRWLSLCFDSLHPYGKGRIQPEHFKGADFYIDEVEQGLRHLFSSSTCSKKRSLIQQTLTEIVNVVLDSGGRIIILDADLSNFSVSYFRDLADKRYDPYIIVNKFNHEAFPVSLYNDSTPAPIMSEIHNELEKGGRILICSDSQKEDKEWGTYNLEQDLRQQFPEKKFIRIDAPNLDDKSSPAWGIFESFDLAIKPYDGVILSPSCNTGLSIELYNHFTAVFGIFKGVLNAYDIHQFLWRVRDPKVRRHIYVKKRGIASNVIFWQEILKRQVKNLAESVARLYGRPVEQVAPIVESIDPIQHRYYAKFTARDNASKLALREHVIELLEEHGHEIKLSDINQAYVELVEVSQIQSALLNQLKPGMLDEERERIKLEVEALDPEREAKEKRFKYLEAVANTYKETHKAVKEKSACELYKAIASAHDIESSDEAMRLEKVRGLGRKDKLALEKFSTKSKYKIDVTEELVKLDKRDRKLLLKFKTHYLSCNPEFLKWRDLSHLESRLAPYRKMEQPPDLKCPLTPQDLKLMSRRVDLVEKLGLLKLLEQASTEEGLKPTSEEITSIVANTFLLAKDVEELFGVKAFEGTGKKPMRIVQELLGESMGLALTRATKKGKRARGQKVERIYRFEKKEGDPRYAIFQAWETEDEQALAELSEERKQEITHEVASWWLETETDPLQAGDPLPTDPLQAGDPLGANSAQMPTSQAIQADPPQSPVKRDPPPAINIVLKDAGSHPDTSFIKAKGKQGEYKYSHNPNPAVEYSPTAVDGGADEEPTALEGLVNRLQAAANKDEALAAVAALPDRLEDALLFIGFGQRQRLRRWLSYKELSDRFGLIADSAEIDEEAFWRIANEFPSTDQGREVVEWAISLLGLDRGWRLQLLWEDGYSHKHGRSLVMA